MSTAYFFINN